MRANETRSRKQRDETMNAVQKIRATADDQIVNPCIAAVALDVPYTKLVSVLRQARIISPYSRKQEFLLGDARKAWNELTN